MNSRTTCRHHPPLVPASSDRSPQKSTFLVEEINRRRGRISRFLQLVLALILALAAITSAIAQSYSPTDIILPEGDYFLPDALNDNGDVAGTYYPAADYERPAIWRNRTFTNLPLLPGAVSGWARGLNNTGQIVGGCGFLQADGTTRSQACVWENGTVRALAGVAGTNASAAWAINDSGTIVGHVYTPLAINGPFREAVIWRGTAVAKLAPPVTGARTWARAIDSSGRVAVSWTTGDDFSSAWHAARWTPSVPNGTAGTMTTLGEWGSAYDINDSGVVSGNQGSYAYLWDGTTATELDGPFWGHKKALGINNTGIAVGYNEDSDWYIYTAWVASGPGGMQDLNLLLTHSSFLAYPGSLVGATSINNAGQILVHTGEGNYTLLTPSSEPPGPQNPAPPTGFYAYEWEGHVEFYWAPAYFAESYNVKRSTVSGGPYTTIASNVPWNTFWDESVVPGTTYYYVVSSVSGSYESANSAESVVPVAGVVPAPPASVSAAAGNAVVVVNWSLADSANSYNVKRSTVSGGPYTTIASGVVDLGFTDTGVVNNTRYFYVVSSQDGTYESGHSAEVTAVPLAPPFAPTNLRGKATQGGKSVNLTWQQSTSPEIRFNRIYRSVNGGAFVQIAQMNAGTNYANSGLTRNTTYSYKVTAMNVNGQEGTASNVVTIRSK